MVVWWFILMIRFHEPIVCRAGFTPPKFLRPGDVVRVEIDGIGELSTTVVPAPPAAAAAAAAVSRL